MINLDETNKKFQESRFNDFTVEELITLMTLNYEFVINDGKIVKMIYTKHGKTIKQKVWKTE